MIWKWILICSHTFFQKFPIRLHQSNTVRIFDDLIQNIVMCSIDTWQACCIQYGLRLTMLLALIRFNLTKIEPFSVWVHILFHVSRLNPILFQPSIFIFCRNWNIQWIHLRALRIISLKSITRVECNVLVRVLIHIIVDLVNRAFGINGQVFISELSLLC